MKLSINFFVFITIVSLALLISKTVTSQEISANETLAKEYFSEGNFEKALPIFTRLVNKSPDNAMYNYYYGVCLIKNNQFNTAAKEALLNAVVDKTPDNCNFYLGNYFQALENWQEALDFYKRYKGSRQERRQLEYDKYFEMCTNHINPFKVEQRDEKTIFIDSITTTIPQPDEKNFPIPDSLESEWFIFQVNSQLTYHTIRNFRSEAARILFTKAWIATAKNDSIVKNTDTLRKAHEETHDVTTRIALVQRIVDAEQQSYQLLRDREKFLEQARVKETGYWEKADPATINNFIKLLNNKQSERLAKIQKEKKETETLTEPVLAAENIIDHKDQVENTDSIQKIEPIATESIIFKVHIGSFPKGRVSTSFKNLYDRLSKFRTIDMYLDEKNTEVYTVGSFTQYRDATLLKNQLILEGAKGSFLAAYKDGKRIPITEAIIPK